jgi:DtxR family Mn-dependent transcriptional regulator
MGRARRERVPVAEASLSPEHDAISPTASRYLEAIFYIDAEGESVRAARLAEWLGVAGATTAGALQRMAAAGLIEVSPSKEITLTTTGRTAAANIVRRHRIAERWLTDWVGLDWLRADEEASKLEHALSDDVADRLHTLIGSPLTCPHGNPIPGVDAPQRNERSLRTLGAGERSKLSRISEVAEHEVPELLRFLADNRLFIGTEVEVVQVSRGGGTQTVRVGDQDVSMSLDVAAKIWVDDGATGGKAKGPASGR